jgi:hypothetical protein
MKALIATLVLIASCASPAVANPFSVDVLLTSVVPGATDGSQTSWKNVAYHTGVAVGPRFGKRWAIVPLANFLPAYRSGNHDTVRPGLGVVYALSSRVDFGIAGIQRPYVSNVAGAVVLGLRL